MKREVLGRFARVLKISAALVGYLKSGHAECAADVVYSSVIRLLAISCKNVTNTHALRTRIPALP
jgi:hypothetical protein